jgi:hypothetical protein
MHCIFGSFLAALCRADAEKMDNDSMDATLSATTDGENES